MVLVIFYFCFIGVFRVIDFEKYKFAKNDVIYDIETYPNVYTFTYYSVLTGEMNTFEISNYRNDTEDRKSVV